MSISINLTDEQIEKTRKISNIVMPISLILFLMTVLFTAIFALDRANWVSLGGSTREAYWYENIVLYLSMIFGIIGVISIILKFAISRLSYKIIYFLNIVLLIVFWFEISLDAIYSITSLNTNADIHLIDVIKIIIFIIHFVIICYTPKISIREK